jgi:hypothetical protein
MAVAGLPVGGSAAAPVARLAGARGQRPGQRGPEACGGGAAGLEQGRGWENTRGRRGVAVRRGLDEGGRRRGKKKGRKEKKKRKRRKGRKEKRKRKRKRNRKIGKSFRKIRRISREKIGEGFFRVFPVFRASA